MPSFWKDWLERVGWTLAQVILGVLIVETADLPYWWVVPLTSVLSMLKGLAARKVGSPDSAAIGGNG